MTPTGLAPRDDNAGQQHNLARDPSAISPSNLIQPPKPCAQAPHSPRSAREAAAFGQANNRYDNNTRQPATYEPYKSSSMSTTGDSSVVTPASSMDIEKSSIAQEEVPRRSHQDPEKAMYHAHHDSRQQINMGDTASMTYSEDDAEDGGRHMQEKKAHRILLFLSGPCVMLSALNTVWACISLVIVLFSQPVRLCARRPTFGQQLAGLLGPALNLQLRCIYTPLAPHANEDSSYHAFTLVVVHVLSPFLSFGMMFVAWVLAVYWLSSAMVGDPGGMDRRDDGRESVLSLRGWWEYWLMRSVKEQ